MREIPVLSKSSAKILLAASEGWNPSQNTYSDAFAHVPTDLALQSIDVSTNPVPQQALLASMNPAILVTSLDHLNICIEFTAKKTEQIKEKTEKKGVPFSAGFVTRL